jgi:hypothetical protein
MTLRALFLAMAALLFADLAGARPDTLWSAMPELAGNSIFYGAAPCANGDILLVGSIDNGSSATQDMLIIRMSDIGEVIWTARPSAGFADIDQAAGVVELPSGEIRVVGWSANGYTLNVLDITAAGYITHAWNYSTTGGRAKGMGIARYPGGDLGVVGYGYGGMSYGSDGWYLRKSADADTLWSMIFHSSGTDAFATVAFQRDYFVLAGYDQQTQGGEYNTWIAKYDTAMNWSMENIYSEDGDQLAYASVLTAADRIYAGGRSGSIPYLMKTNANTVQIWSRTDYAPNGVAGQIRGIATYAGEQPLCAGWLDVGGGRDCWLMLADSSGDSLWTWNYAVGDTAGFYGITQLNCGGYVAYGFAHDGTNTRAYALRIAPDQGVIGTVRNAAGQSLAGVQVHAIGQTCGTASGPTGRFVLGLPAGTYRLVISGPCIESDTTAEIVLNPDTLLPVAITAHVPGLGPLPTSLNLLARNHEPATGTLALRNFGDGTMHFAVTVTLEDPDEDGDWMTVTPLSGEIPALSEDTLYVNISADTTDDGTYEYYGRLMIRTNACPDSVTEIPVFVTVLDAEVPEALAREFAVSDAYPNPFNGQTSFSMTLPREADIALRVYDVTGRTVRDLDYGQMVAGSHSLSLDLGSFATGVYFVRIRAGEFSTVRKLLLTK